MVRLGIDIGGILKNSLIVHELFMSLMVEDINNLILSKRLVEVQRNSANVFPSLLSPWIAARASRMGWFSFWSIIGVERRETSKQIVQCMESA